LIIFLIALVVAFAFEFINGFHDTANAVTTVIYTRTLKATPAVIYSGFMNFLGALVTVTWLGAGVAFGIVNLLPVDILVNAKSTTALIAVLALLTTGVFWNLSTWYLGLPVSSSHTLIGSILGAGIASSLLSEKQSLDGVNWDKAKQTFFFLFVSPVVGFVLAALLLLGMKVVARDKRLYEPPVGDDKPPKWIRGVLIGTCGGVSFMHGSNDGQKGMGLILLILIGFLPFHYALDGDSHKKLPELLKAIDAVKTVELPEGDAKTKSAKDVQFLEETLKDKACFDDLPPDQKRWEVRQAIFRLGQILKKNPEPFKAAVPDEAKRKEIQKAFNAPIEYVPIWVVVGTALALGIGTTIGYKRIVETVAEKIGKTHLTYAQGAAAEMVAAITIGGADLLHAPVSTTQVLSSGVAGTMVANNSGVQMATARKILLAWIFTLPCTALLAGLLFWIGKTLFA
jgi:phosphate/sulfate permease